MILREAYFVIDVECKYLSEGKTFSVSSTDTPRTENCCMSEKQPVVAKPYLDSAETFPENPAPPFRRHPTPPPPPPP